MGEISESFLRNLNCTGLVRIVIRVRAKTVYPPRTLDGLQTKLVRPKGGLPQRSFIEGGICEVVLTKRKGLRVR